MIEKNNAARALLLALPLAGLASSLLCCAKTRPPSSGRDIEFVRASDNKNLILFVHGVFGDLRRTWHNPNTQADWYDLLRNDRELDRFDIALTHYYSPIGGKAMTLQDVAANFLESWKDEKLFTRYDKIFIIAHSMGGVIAQQILVSLDTPGDQRLLQRIACVVLLATPSSGARLAHLAKWLGLDAQLADLGSASSWLQAVQAGLVTLRNERARGSAGYPRLYAAYETRPFHHLLVVSRPEVMIPVDSALMPFDLDHAEMAAPAGRDARLYKWAKERILNADRANHRPTVAVLTSQQYRPGGAAWPGVALPDVITAFLRQGGAVTAVDREDVVHAEMDASPKPDELLAYYRAALGADYVVSGTYEADDDKLSAAKIEIEDTATRQATNLRLDRSQSAGLLELGERIADEIRGALGLERFISADTGNEVRRLFSFPTGCPQHEYFQAVQLLRRFEAADAIPALRLAARCSGSPALVHKALVRALVNSRIERLDTEVQAEFAKALGAAKGIPACDSLEIAALYHHVGHDREEVNDYTRLRSMCPADRYERQQAAAQIDWEDYRGALATIDDARRNGEHESPPELDLLEAEAYSELGRPLEQAAAAWTVRQKVPWGKRLPAEARLWEAKADIELGNFEAARIALEAARPVFHELKRFDLEAQCDELLARQRFFPGEFATKEGLLDKAAELYDLSGEHCGKARVLLAKSMFYGDRGAQARMRASSGVRPASLPPAGRGDQRARALKAEAKAAGAACPDSDWKAVFERDSGIDYFFSGDLVRAEATLREASLGFQGDPHEQAKCEDNLGEVYFTQGNLRRARETFQAAKQRHHRAGDLSREKYCDFWLGRIAAAEGNLKEALGIMSTAVNPQSNMRFAAVGLAGLAEVKGLAGDLGGAETDARDAADSLSLQQADDDAALAKMVLAEVEIKQHRFEAAAADLEDAAALARKVPDIQVSGTANVDLVDIRLYYRKRILRRLLQGAWHQESLESSLDELGKIASEARVRGHGAFEIASLFAVVELEVDHGLDYRHDLGELAARARVTGMVGALDQAAKLVANHQAARPAGLKSTIR